MPINAPIEYFKAEEKFRSAKTKEEKMKALEEMIRLLPKHKGTENVLKELRRKLAKLRSQPEKKAVAKPKIIIKKEGAGQICLVGLTNSGKSTLLKQLTGVDVEIADYPYTTKEPKVGMMQYEDVQIQIVEIPSTFSNEALNVVRNSDGIILVLDGTKNLVDQKNELIRIMNDAKIKINEKPRNIKIKKRASGGIEIVNKNLIEGDVEEVKDILSASGYNNCLLVVNEKVSIDDIMNALDRSLVYKNAISVVTKNPHFSLKELKQKIWKMLGLIRVYTKSPNKEPEKKPITLPLGSTVKDVAKAIHKDFLSHFKFARIWGSSKFPGQKVGLDYVLKDRDVVEIHS
jgi:hypothetical protein